MSKVNWFSIYDKHLPSELKNIRSIFLLGRRPGKTEALKTMAKASQQKLL